jgi:hypothetical protein
LENRDCRHHDFLAHVLDEGQAALVDDNRCMPHTPWLHHGRSVIG